MPSLKEARGACQETEFQTVDESSSGLRFAGWKKRNVSWALIAGDSEPRSQLLDVVNLRVGGLDAPEPSSIAEPFSVLTEMQQEGLIKHLGVITVNAEQVAEAQSIAPVVCVQNFYNIAHREDDSLIHSLAEQGIAYVPSGAATSRRRCAGDKRRI